MYIFLIIGEIMKLFERNFKVLESFKETVNSYEFLLSTRRRAKDFSRYRKMCFSDIISCMLNFFKKDAQIEVDEFMQNVKRTDITMSEQAFLKARQKVLPEAFTILNDVMVKDVYFEPEYYYT